MQKVIVTGATSMLGVATIKECLKNNIQVTAILRKGSKNKKKIPQSERITLIECDLEELKSLILPEKNYDVFFHFGWANTDKATRDDPVLQAFNIGYTLDAVQLAYRCGCKKFLGAGSQAEYGFWDRILTEESYVNPAVSYGYAKFAAGKLAEKLCEKFRIVCIWTRIFSVYGKNDGENSMISYAIRCWKNKEKARFSAGTQMWDFLYEEDAGKYFYLLAEKVQKHVVVNVASGTARRLKDYIVQMKEALEEVDKDKELLYSLTTWEDKQLNGIWPDVSKLIGLTEYTPLIQFKDGIKRIAEMADNISDVR